MATEAAKPVSTASGWEKWHDWNERAMRPVADWVAEHAGIGPGLSVLDLASGTGLPALSLAARVRPGGRVVATDASPEMLAATRAQATRAGLDNVECREMPFEEIAFDDASFDVVTCTFGLMFSKDQPKVVREIQRVLKPGGRFAIVVWDLPEKNPYFTTTFDTVGRFMPPPPPAPSGPSMFGLGKAGVLRELLEEGGLAPSIVESRSFEIEFDSVEQHWEIFSDMAPPVARARQTLPASELARLRAALADVLAPTVKDGRPRLTATPVFAAGTR